jgi:hypothetical protein
MAFQRRPGTKAFVGHDNDSLFITDGTGASTGGGQILNGRCEKPFAIARRVFRKHNYWEECERLKNGGQVRSK